MKKLTKKINMKKENIEAYDTYFAYSCSCRSYCNGDSKASYRNFKGLQAE